jgi:hypothetical protein
MTPISAQALMLNVAEQLAGTASPRHFLLIRRLISRPDQLTFYLC